MQYTFPMRLNFKALIFLIIAGSLIDFAYASLQQGCSCCDQECQNTRGCQENTRVCLCGYSAPLQLDLVKRDIQLNLVTSGSLATGPDFAYVFIPAEGVFHPPRQQTS